ncbi:MAG: metal-dependent hydrolase [candidate division Zixibacteria bacterium]|nr:metal-dependent hydrolase [candidate division Zixibacteria bacterium]
MPTVQYLSHASFLVETGGRKILIDPFFTGNPKAPADVSRIDPDYILVTHGHGDHLGDTIPIAKRTNATVVAPNELAVWCQEKGAKTHAMHIGGGWDFDFGRVQLTIAHHGSAVAGPNGWEYTGNPCGFLVTSEGKTLYHAGDTGLFYDMKLIGEMHPIDLALLPIGDNFTMGVQDAIKAVELLRPRQVVPMHYDTFDMIKADPRVFAAGAAQHGAKVTILAVGEKLTY